MGSGESELSRLNDCVFMGNEEVGRGDAASPFIVLGALL